MWRALVLAALPLVLAGTAAAEPMRGDGAGCRDKAVAAELLSLEDFDPAYIAIWANGMRNQSCRGYGAGQDVTVDARADGMACVRAADDEECFWVAESVAP